VRAGGPKRDSLDAVQYSLHYGVVVQNKDPDNLNRIKVRLPWLDQGETDESHWAQLVTPMEGKKFGIYVLPDIDDVVAVMFIGGDISQPVILGGIWSKPDFSPETNEDGKNNFRGYRSRTGHRLILDDSSKTKIVLADKTAKNTVGMGQFDTDGAGPNKSAVFKPPMSGTVGASFSSMEGNLEITCTKGALKVEAGQNIKINATKTIDINSKGALEVKGQSAAKLTSVNDSNYDGQTVDIA
jgi:uncharacterized protein involved in type VI secretion and phage assembly